MKATDVANEAKTGLILLAAGKSIRLGHPKQLLPYNGQTLLQHSASVALASDAHPVIMVLGAESTLIGNGIAGSRFTVVVNKEWQEGMASSIRTGIQALQRLNPGAAGAVIMVCDQPYVTPELINRLINIHLKTEKPIVSCQYADTVGTPTFFHKSMFPELLELKGDVGAKSLLLKHAETMEMIHFPEGRFDIDTEADYAKLKERG